MLYDLGPRARRVHAVLQERIRSGKLLPGVRLPPHTQLAGEFGVAPLTMRQVLARLEADGLLARELGRGTFIRAAERTEVLIVVRSPRVLGALLSQLRRAGQRAIVATTAAEGLAALEREPAVALLVIDLALPTASAGLSFARAARRQRASLPIAVLHPTRLQRIRLEHTVPPPLLSVDHPIAAQLEQVLRSVLVRPPVNVEPVATETTLVPRVKDLLDRYLAVQLAGERGAARQIVLNDGLAAGVSVADLFLSVLQPAQYRVGELWQRNQISIAEEHLATGVTASVMGELATLAPRVTNTGVRVLVACVEGELHDLGARMVADLMELDGFAVRFLGANVPTDSLLAMIEQQQPGLIVLSVTMPEHVDQLRQVLARLGWVRGVRVPVFVGGQALQWVPDLTRHPDIDLTAHNATETLQAARRMFATK